MSQRVSYSVQYLPTVPLAVCVFGFAIFFAKKNNNFKLKFQILWVFQKYRNDRDSRTIFVVSRFSFILFLVTKKLY